LTNLDLLPEYGALVVVAFPKPLDGSGFPARVFAILP
jgi:kynurenine formamidase